MTKIEWTEESWNPVTGCTKVSEGCRNCYAEMYAKRFWGARKFTDILFHPERIKNPYFWHKPRMVFVNSMSDLFHPEIGFEIIDEIFTAMEENKRHTFQILTKRAERLYEYYLYREERNIKNGEERFEFAENIWIGISAENQTAFDNRIVPLIKTGAKIKFLSLEPLLGNINLESVLARKEYFGHVKGNAEIDWVIVGCETGANRRECELERIENIVNQCKAGNVPVFVKQIDFYGRVLKDFDQFPEKLKFREYPEQVR